LTSSGNQKRSENQEVIVEARVIKRGRTGGQEGENTMYGRQEWGRGLMKQNKKRGTQLGNGRPNGYWCFRSRMGAQEAEDRAGPKARWSAGYVYNVIREEKERREEVS
jgi:hypothetical protein